MKKTLLIFFISILLTACNQSVEEEAYKANQNLISKKFPVPDSLEFPRYEEKNVLCKKEMCSVKGTVKYENQYGVMVEGDYESILTYDDDYFYLQNVDIYER